MKPSWTHALAIASLAISSGLPMASALPIPTGGGDGSPAEVYTCMDGANMFPCLQDLACGNGAGSDACKIAVCESAGGEKVINHQVTYKVSTDADAGIAADASNLDYGSFKYLGTSGLNYRYLMTGISGGCVLDANPILDGWPVEILHEP